MKKKLILVLFLTAAISWLTIAQAHAVSVSLDIPDDAIMVGESFEVELWVDGDGIEEALLAFGFDVVTSETYFTYMGYSIGGDFTDFSDPFNPYNVAGAGLVFDDEVLLATLSFSADAIGPDTLTVLGIYDEMFYGLFYEVSGVDISASTEININPIPEPSTLLLLFFGLGGLAGFRRRFRRR